MANATNGPVDPDAGIDRRGRVERTRAQADPAAPAAPVRRARTVAATSTTRSPVTAQTEPARKPARKPSTADEPARKPVGKKSTTATEPAKPAAVKSTSSRPAATRTTARKTATSAAATPDEQPRPARRRATKPAETTTEPDTGGTAPNTRRTADGDDGPTGRARRTAEGDDGPTGRARRTGRAVAAPPEEAVPVVEEAPEPPAMTRGIVELAAERLAASQAAREQKPEPPAPADDDPMAAPGAYMNPRAAGGRRTGRSGGIRAVPGGTRPGTGSRPPLASRPPAGPPEAVRPHSAGPERWDGLSPGNGWLGTPGAPSGREDEPVIVGRPGAHRATNLPEPPGGPAVSPDLDAGPAGIEVPGSSPEGPAAGPDLHAGPAGIEVPGSSPEGPAAGPDLHAGPAGTEAPGSPFEDGPDVRYRRTRNRPGLPPSLRLPAELPDNLWPPPALMDRSLAENIYVPPPAGEAPQARSQAPARPEARPMEEEPEARPEARPEVPEVPEDPGPAATRRPHSTDLSREDEHEPAFLPSVLERGDHDIEYVPAHSREHTPARHAAPETAVARRVRRRRRAVLIAYLLVVIVVLIVGHQLRGREEPLAPGRDAAQRAAEPAGVGPAAGPEPPMTRAEPVEPDATADKPKAKAGEFKYERDRGPMLGSGGKLYRFRVAVEKIVEGTSAGEFAESIDETLGDERSWINDGRLRLRRVADAGDDVDFTIYLASARTSERMCAAGGLDTEGFTSCRIPGQVIINADRWAGAVPDYQGRLEQYRQYTINHEVGHELGHGHEKCPGEGEKAPVMMQQTFGLKGCTPNSWPYLDGERYSGEPVA
ncbi:DUF3152 domain-containing protein [Actinoplanes sp. NPDC049802]|uniref:DUF3152 domain-containing protein n=1 Tax=Actinoplanes sp. NPDC049802 TaxID=3154742 RepID=UPI0033F4522B